jgi:hypothetical protein
MKTKFIAPLLIAALLAGSTVVIGQDRNEKKIERLQHKIEKQSQKLHELTGNTEIVTMGHAWSPLNENQIAKIRDEARAQADQAREQAAEVRAQAGEVRARVRESMDRQHEMGQKLKEMKEFEIQKNINGKRYNYYYKTPKFQYREGSPMAISVPGYKIEAADVNVDIPDIKMDYPQFKGQVYSVFGGSQNNLEINKNLTADETSTADFNYEVKKGANGISVNVEGAIDSGKVKVTIKLPNGEVYNEYSLSPLANVNWNQTISIDEENEAGYIGKWTVTVAAEKAKGNYSVKLGER